MQKQRQKGEGNNNWRGGISSVRQKIHNTEEYNLWRYAVFKRDNFICQKCNMKSDGNKNSIVAHHKYIFSKYPEKRLDVNNGITLCVKCHRRVHSEKNPEWVIL